MGLYKEEVNKSDRAQLAYQYFTNKGLEPHLAAGIVGNLMRESYTHLDSSAEDGTGAIGIAQWMGNRKSNLETFASKRGKNATDFDTQLDFLWKELHTTGDSWLSKNKMESFFNAKDQQEAATIFGEHFERPAEKPGDENFNKRIKYANSVYDLYATDDPNKSEDKEEKVDVGQDERALATQAVDKTAVNTPNYTEDLLRKNNELLQKVLTEKEQEAVAQEQQDEATAAQQRLEVKKQQKDYLQKIISESSVEFVEQRRRQPDNDPVPNSYGYPNSYKDGGEHRDPPGDEREQGLKIKDNIPNQFTMKEEKIDPVFFEQLPEIFLTHDKSNYAGEDKEPNEKQLKTLEERLDKFELRDEREDSIVKKDETLSLFQEKEIIGDLKEGQKISEEDFRQTITDIESTPEIDIRQLNKISPETIDISDLGKLDSAELTKVQKELEQNGYLKPNYEPVQIPSSKEEVVELQQMLVSKGFNLGTYGENGNGVDGIAGAKTQAAIREYNKGAVGVDGIAGENTKEALRAFKKDQFKSNLDPYQINERFIELKSDEDLVNYQTNLETQGFFQGIDYEKATGEDIVPRTALNSFKVNSSDKAKDPRCTWFVGQEIEKMVKESGREKIDGYGDAWTITDRLVNKGAEVLFSVFEDEKPQLNSDEIEPYLKERIAQAGAFDPSGLQSGDLVNFFYEGSTSKDKAYSKGGKYFTSHTGIIKAGKDGKLVVEHNVGGTIHREELETLAAGGGKNKAGKQLSVSAITRPDYGMSNIDQEVSFHDSTKAYINTDKVQNFNNIGNENAAIFTQTIIKNQKALQGDIPIDNREFELLAKAAKVIGWKESGFSGGVDRASGIDYRSGAKTFGKVREAVGGTELSRGVTQMKDQKNLTPNLRKKYIKGDGENLSNPAEAAIPTFYALSSRYTYLRDFAVKNDIGASPEDLAKLSTVAWNQPLHKVAKTLLKSGNFDKTIEAYRGEDGKFSYDLALTGFDEYLE